MSSPYNFNSVASVVHVYDATPHLEYVDSALSRFQIKSKYFNVSLFQLY